MSETPKQKARKIIDAIDRASEPLRGADYREFLEEIDGDVESRLVCLDEEEAEDE